MGHGDAFRPTILPVDEEDGIQGAVEGLRSKQQEWYDMGPAQRLQFISKIVDRHDALLPELERQQRIHRGLSNETTVESHIFNFNNFFGLHLVDYERFYSALAARGGPPPLAAATKEGRRRRSSGG